MDRLLHDIRYGLRGIFKNPSFAVVALLTLTLGIGGTTAMFSVVNAVLLRQLPYQDPSRLVLIRELIPKIDSTPISVPAPDILDFRDRSQAFSGVAGFEGRRYEWIGRGAPQQVQGTRVSFNTLSVLGVSPVLGRSFTAEEDRPGQHVVILSYSLWQREFGGDRGVLGRTVSLNRIPYTVVGVMPPQFLFPVNSSSTADPSQLWVPLALTPEEIAARGDNFDDGVVARIKPGVSFAQTQSDVDRVAQYIREQYPPEVRGELDMRGVITPLSEVAFGDLRRPMLALFGGVFLILLIAAANVANLLLTRATGRQKEIAVRIALGATPARLITQLLAESVTLSLAGGALGTLFAAFATDLIVSLVPGNVPRLHQAQVDVRTLAFAFAISLLAGVVFGLAPVFLALRTRLNENLKEGGRGGSFGRQHRRLRSGLVVAEVSLALVLLFAAGLLLRSFQKLLETNPGFAPDHLITASVSLPAAQYPQAQQMRSFQHALLERMQQLPGGRSAGMATDLPLESDWIRIFTADGYNPPPGAGMNVDSHTVVGGDYFQAMGIPLVRGRNFLPSDDAHSLPVIIVSQSLAEKYWHGQDPIGKRLKWGPAQSDSPWLTVVGVVGDVKQQALDKTTLPHTYQPYAQLKDDLVVQGIVRTLRMVVRTSGDPRSAAASLKAAVWGLDRQLAVTKLRTMEEVLSESSAPRRFNMILVLLFAGTALLLAAIGIYGVIAYSVAQRTQEIGIRMTLGAERVHVLRMVLGWGVLLTGTGTILGLAASLAAARLLRGFVFGIQATDPLTFVVVVAVLVATALLATCVPAWRAARVDPMVALRHE